jgi:SAM-dependent methyltransferase
MNKTLKQILKRIGVYHPLQQCYRQSIKETQKFIYRFKYKKLDTGGYYCNFCYSRYNAFVDDYPNEENANAIQANSVIAGYGCNVICPNCLSTSRERLIKCTLDKYITEDDKYILHFSPEKSLFNWIKKFNRVVTADITPGFYTSIDKNIVNIDITQMQLENELFDCVIANHVLEHIPNDLQAMKEIYRVLKPGGKAVLQVPYSIKFAHTIEDPLINNPTMQSRLFGQNDHVRIYSLNDFVSLLESVGFKVKIVSQDLLDCDKHISLQRDEVFLDIIKPVF